MLDNQSIINEVLDNIVNLHVCFIHNIYTDLLYKRHIYEIWSLSKPTTKGDMNNIRDIIISLIVDNKLDFEFICELYKYHMPWYGRPESHFRYNQFV
jgi:hypothetical protein